MKFGDFLNDTDRHLIVSTSVALTFTFILDLIFSLQPPWPKSSTYITAFLEVTIVVIANNSGIKSKIELRRQQIIFTIFTIICMAVYFIVYSLFVYNDPGNKAIVGGFYCTELTEKFVVKSFGENCPFLSQNILAAAQFNPEILWTRMSISVTSLTLLFSWIFFFVFINYIVTISVVHYRGRNTAEKRISSRRD